ncbi:hypothetical protein HK102_005206, partial [Quaeritorhiza haematococci]
DTFIGDLLSESTSASKPRIRFLILDFSLITGIDYSATEAFLRIKKTLRQQRTHLVFVGLGSVGGEFFKSGIFDVDVEEEEEARVHGEGVSGRGDGVHEEAAEREEEEEDEEEDEEEATEQESLMRSMPCNEEVVEDSTQNHHRHGAPRETANTHGGHASQHHHPSPRIVITNRYVHIFKTLNEALEWCENHLLAAYYRRLNAIEGVGGVGGGVGGEDGKRMGVPMEGDGQVAGRGVQDDGHLTVGSGDTARSRSLAIPSPKRRGSLTSESLSYLSPREQQVQQAVSIVLQDEIPPIAPSITEQEDQSRTVLMEAFSEIAYANLLDNASAAAAAASTSSITSGMSSTNTPTSLSPASPWPVSFPPPLPPIVVDQQLQQPPQPPQQPLMSLPAPQPMPNFPNTAATALTSTTQYTDQELREMCRLFERVEVPKGTMLWEAGDVPATELYVVETGELQLLIHDREYGYRVVETLLRGTMVGELEMLSNRPRTCRLAASKDLDCVLWMLTKDRYEELTERDPRLALKFAR